MSSPLSIHEDSHPAAQPDLASQDAHNHFVPPAAEVRPAGMAHMQEIACLAHEHVEGPETPVDEAPDQRKGKLQEQLEEAVTGQFNIQSSLGRRFMREVKAEGKLRSDYLRLSDNKAKADFRKRWAEQMLEEVKSMTQVKKGALRRGGHLHRDLRMPGQDHRAAGLPGGSRGGHHQRMQVCQEVPSDEGQMVRHELDDQ